MDDAYKNAYAEGLQQGHGIGYDIGYNEGYGDGVQEANRLKYEDGYENGYNDGLREGKKEVDGDAYSGGYSDGFNDGTLHGQNRQFDEFVDDILDFLKFHGCPEEIIQKFKQEDWSVHNA